MRTRSGKDHGAGVS
jgi:hypothetical protein